MERFKAESFFDLTGLPAAGLFVNTEYVWDAVVSIPAFIERIIEPAIMGEVEEGAWLEPGAVRLEKGARVERGAIIRGPAIIGGGSVVRSGAYVRGHVMLGENCLLGHGTETRQTVVLNNTNIPHLNCVFTSVLGNSVRLGGCVNTANYLLSGREVQIRLELDGEKKSFPTGSALFGAIIGDGANVGGVSVLQAGSIIGRNCMIYPQCSFSGYAPDGSTVKPATPYFEVIPKEAKS